MPNFKHLDPPGFSSDVIISQELYPCCLPHPTHMRSPTPSTGSSPPCASPTLVCFSDVCLSTGALGAGMFSPFYVLHSTQHTVTVEEGTWATCPQPAHMSARVPKQSHPAPPHRQRPRTAADTHSSCRPRHDASFEPGCPACRWAPWGPGAAGGKGCSSCQLWVTAGPSQVWLCLPHP